MTKNGGQNSKRDFRPQQQSRQIPFATKEHLRVQSAKITYYRKGAVTSMIIKTWNDIQKKN